MKRRARVRVPFGERRRQALEWIAAQEKAARAWGPKDMGDALGISTQQAWSLMQSLTYAGELTRGRRTVVLENVLRLARAA